MIGRGGDATATYAHLALQKHQILPRDYLAMSAQERAFLLASDLTRAEEERRALPRAARRQR